MDLKPGFKTSEFWLTYTTVFVQTVLLLASYLIFAKAEADMRYVAFLSLLYAVAVSVPTAIYSYSRGRVKTAAALRGAIRRAPKRNDVKRTAGNNRAPFRS